MSPSTSNAPSMTRHEWNHAWLSLALENTMSSLQAWIITKLKFWSDLSGVACNLWIYSTFNYIYIQNFMYSIIFLNFLNMTYFSISFRSKTAKVKTFYIHELAPFCLKHLNPDKQQYKCKITKKPFLPKTIQGRFTAKSVILIAAQKFPYKVI